MEANEFYNISIAPLVVAPFSLEWSEDNHISLITHRGVDVFEFIPHPMCIYPTLKFWRSFIYPSEFMPAEGFEKFINEALWKMDREEIYALLLEAAVTPKMNEKTSTSPRIIKIAWSPVKLASPSKCLAAILTSAGSIEILYKLGSEWLSVWNISDRWSRVVEQETKINPADATENSFDGFSWASHVKRLLGTAMSWSPLFRDSDGTPYAYLVAAFRSSDLVISRIERIDDLGKVEEPSVARHVCLRTSAKIVELLWIVLEPEKRHLIMIGYADGRIHGLRIRKSSDKLVEEELLRYEDRADRASPTSLRRVKRENGNSLILATKSSRLVVLSLDNNGECLKTRYLKVQGFSITGLTVVSRDMVILTTQNCRMYAVTIGEMETELTASLVKHDLKTSNVQFLGMAGSPNSAILLNVTSPDSMYDHLVNREPSTLQIFGLLGDEWNPWRVTSKKLEANASLDEYWDCIESLRINAAGTIEPDKILPRVPSNLDGLTIDKLRLVMWLTLISRVLERKQMLKGVDKIVGEISEAQPLIFLTSACGHLDRLAGKILLTDEEKRCASFLRMYMEIYLAGEEGDEEKDEEKGRGTGTSDITQRVTETFRASSHIDTIETDSCNLCGDILNELPWTVDTCPSGHKLSRCSVTLLQITSVRYRSCPVCERLFHPSLDAEYGETRCLYCYVPAIYDTRVALSNHPEDLELRWKNLSKRPASYGQPETPRVTGEVENHNGATPMAVNDRVKRRGYNPHTFAVIVNRDQDDDSMITETWQEF